VMDAYSLIHKKPWSDGLHNIFDQADINIFENKCRWCLDGDGGGGDGGDGGDGEDGDSYGGFDSAASDEGIGGDGEDGDSYGSFDPGDAFGSFDPGDSFGSFDPGDAFGMAGLASLDALDASALGDMYGPGMSTPGVSTSSLGTAVFAGPSLVSLALAPFTMGLSIPAALGISSLANMAARGLGAPESMTTGVFEMAAPETVSSLANMIDTNVPSAVTDVYGAISSFSPSLGIGSPPGAPTETDQTGLSMAQSIHSSPIGSTPSYSSFGIGSLGMPTSSLSAYEPINQSSPFPTWQPTTTLVPTSPTSYGSSPYLRQLRPPMYAAEGGEAMFGQ
jgi:hypothetical protein